MDQIITTFVIAWRHRGEILRLLAIPLGIVAILVILDSDIIGALYDTFGRPEPSIGRVVAVRVLGTLPYLAVESAAVAVVVTTLFAAPPQRDAQSSSATLQLAAVLIAVQAVVLALALTVEQLLIRSMTALPAAELQAREAWLRFQLAVPDLDWALPAATVVAVLAAGVASRRHKPTLSRALIAGVLVLVFTNVVAAVERSVISGLLMSLSSAATPPALGTAAQLPITLVAFTLTVAIAATAIVVAVLAPPRTPRPKG